MPKVLAPLHALLIVTRIMTDAMVMPSFSSDTSRRQFLGATPGAAALSTVVLNFDATKAFAKDNFRQLGVENEVTNIPAVVPKSTGKISDRLIASSLVQPGVQQRSELDVLRGGGTGALGGLYSDVFYPKWMAGEWEATTVLRSYAAPLGLKYLAGPSGMQMDIARSTMAKEEERVGKIVGPYSLKWVIVDGDGAGKIRQVPLDESFRSSRDPGDYRSLPFVVEDRAFNTASRLNAFAGKDVVKSVEYVEVGGANKMAYGDAPLPTTLTRYRGPAVAKFFSNSRGMESSSAWTGFEATRTLFARTDIDMPPVVTDSEVITQLNPPELEDTVNGLSTVVVTGRVRIADYLTPNDALFFDARRKSVSISDYDIILCRRQ